LDELRAVVLAAVVEACAAKVDKMGDEHTWHIADAIRNLK
jgi:hypothetical protein